MANDAARILCLIIAIGFLLGQIALELYLYWLAVGVIGFWPVLAIVAATIVLGILFRIAVEGAN